MNSIVYQLNGVSGRLFDLLTGGHASWLALLLISVVSGVLLLLIYGRISSQRALRNVKRAIAADIIEAFLFRHSLATSLRAQGRAFLHGGKYFLLAVPPIVVLAVPCIIVLAQLNAFYGARPLKVGEQALLAADFTGIDPQQVRIEAPEGVQLSPPVRIPSQGAAFWRIEGQVPGSHRVALVVGDKRYEKTVVVGAEQDGRIMAVESAHWFESLLFPGELRLVPGQDTLQKLTLRYPEGELELLGLQLHWLVVFFVVSLLSGLLAAKIFHIEI